MVNVTKYNKFYNKFAIFSSYIHYSLSIHVHVLGSVYSILAQYIHSVYSLSILAQYTRSVYLLSILAQYTHLYYEVVRILLIL